MVYLCFDYCTGVVDCAETCALFCDCRIWSSVSPTVHFTFIFLQLCSRLMWDITVFH
uniref:Ovule protein n=1 Tax=Ascaris lumbricoides TaxID=6252 RepID=A0A0M3IBV3_ASCLU